MVEINISREKNSCKNPHNATCNIWMDKLKVMLA
jgi:hypothetical protein